MRLQAGLSILQERARYSRLQAAITCDCRRALRGKSVGFVTIGPLICDLVWRNGMKRVVRFVAAAIAICFSTNLRATGYYGPMVYLDNGGKSVDASPEFYWELEVKR